MPDTDLSPMERAIGHFGTVARGRAAVATLRWLRTTDPDAFDAVLAECGLEGHAVLGKRVVELEPWHAWHNSLGYYHALRGPVPVPSPERRAGAAVVVGPPSSVNLPGRSYIALYSVKQHTEGEGA